MNPAELLDFMRHHSLAVQASVSAAAAPQGAVVGFVVTDRFELFFDTVDTTRKVQNLRRKLVPRNNGGSSGNEARRSQSAPPNKRLKLAGCDCFKGAGVLCTGSYPIPRSSVLLGPPQPAA